MFHVAWKRVMKGLHSLEAFIEGLERIGISSVYPLGETGEGQWKGIGVELEWPDRIVLEHEGYRTHIHAQVDEHVGKQLLALAGGMGGKIRVNRGEVYEITGRNLSPLFFTRVLEYALITSAVGYIPDRVDRSAQLRRILYAHGIPNMDFRLFYKRLPDSPYPAKKNIIHAFLYESERFATRLLLENAQGLWYGFLDISPLQINNHKSRYNAMYVEHVTGIPILRFEVSRKTLNSTLRALGKIHKSLSGMLIR